VLCGNVYVPGGELPFHTARGRSGDALQELLDYKPPANFHPPPVGVAVLAAVAAFQRKLRFLGHGRPLRLWQLALIRRPLDAATEPGGHAIPAADAAFLAGYELPAAAPAAAAPLSEADKTAAFALLAGFVPGRGVEPAGAVPWTAAPVPFLDRNVTLAGGLWWGAAVPRGPPTARPRAT